MGEGEDVVTKDGRGAATATRVGAGRVGPKVGGYGSGGGAVAVVWWDGKEGCSEAGR